MRKFMVVLAVIIASITVLGFKSKESTYADTFNESNKSFNIDNKYSNYFNLNSQASTRMLPSSGYTYTLATVYTPKKSAVEVIRFTSMDGFDANELNRISDSEFPEATRISSADYRYNCHSYAWYSASTTKNNYWMNYPTSYYTDGSFYESTAKVGNIICYYNSIGENLHSGVITAIDSSKSGLSSIIVTSKWGAYGVYRHSANYCPYPSSNIKYYEHVTHTYNNRYIYKDSSYHKSYCSCGEYILGGHYTVSPASVEEYELLSEEDTNAIIGRPGASCALCGGLLDPDKPYPGIITSLEEEQYHNH